MHTWRFFHFIVQLYKREAVFLLRADLCRECLHAAGRKLCPRVGCVRSGQIETKCHSLEGFISAHTQD
ncbi:hypothetical protein ILYODFUR_026505 [Ilyodon furcidens]|uniref:Secreted protein n=1 Tax=Ilyodon furcidens TaxID=33524 RepID=A0ABV0TYB0_9TELE